jgi:hypothetical protein
MTHDPQRVASIRDRAGVQLARAAQLQARITRGELPLLKVAQTQLGAIETFFLAHLQRQERTPKQEAFWLDQAERMLQISTAEVNRIEEGTP